MAECLTTSPADAKAVQVTRKAAAEFMGRFHLHMVLPLIAIVIAFLAETLLPAYPRLRNPEDRHCQRLLAGLFGIFAVLAASAYFEEAVRKALASRTALSVTALILDGFILAYFDSIGKGEYAGFQIFIVALAGLMTIFSAASWISARVRSHSSPGFPVLALFLTLLIAVLQYGALLAAQKAAEAAGEVIEATGSPVLEAVQYALIVLVIIALALGITLLLVKNLRRSLKGRGVFIAALILLLGVINVVTAKFELLPQIYFPSISRIIHVYEEEFNFLFLNCLVSSFVLLIEGVGVGVIIGVVTGVLVGWSQKWNYWVNPLVRILGPIPTSTWIPLALVAFSTPRSAAIFVIAFGVWFQISILTASGIQNVKKTYYEVSSTLGATETQNLFYIAIPDALPSIFLGLFNATCTSFAALVVAEMLGVKNGIGWYMNWQKEMLAYPGVYAGLFIIAGFCYLFITVQFKLRDKLLSWQKGVIKW